MDTQVLISCPGVNAENRDRYVLVVSPSILRSLVCTTVVWFLKESRNGTRNQAVSNILANIAFSIAFILFTSKNLVNDIIQTIAISTAATSAVTI